MVVDNDLTGHMRITPEYKQAEKTLADLCVCWSAIVSVNSAVDCNSNYRPRDENMGSELQGISKGCRKVLVKDLRIIGGRLAKLHIKVKSDSLAVALQPLPNVIRWKDSVFFILTSDSVRSKLLLPFVEATEVLQLFSNTVVRKCTVMGYTEWLNSTHSTNSASYHCPRRAPHPTSRSRFHCQMYTSIAGP